MMLPGVKFAQLKSSCMYRWIKANKNQEQLFNLYSKLKYFHDTLQRSAMRDFSDTVKNVATSVALKGYALVSLIADRHFLLRYAPEDPCMLRKASFPCTRWANFSLLALVSIIKRLFISTSLYLLSSSSYILLSFRRKSHE